MEREKWLPVPGYPAYLISDRGRLMGMGRHKKGYVLIKPNCNSRGYLIAEIYSGGPRGKRFRINQLVLLAFVGPPSNKDLVCAHLDDVKTNNKLANLAWVTRKENRRQAHLNKRYLTGANHPMAKLSASDRKHIENAYWHIKAERRSNVKELAKQFNVSTSAVTRVVALAKLSALVERK